MCARLSLQTAWPLIGLSILFLTVSLHGEVRITADLVKRLAEDIRQHPGVPKPSVVRPRPIYAVAEKAAYVCLALSVLALVAHGVSRCGLFFRYCSGHLLRRVCIMFLFQKPCILKPKTWRHIAVSNLGINE